MGSAIKVNDIDLEKITFSTPKTLDNGGKMLYLNYNGGVNPLRTTVPESKLPFDPSYFPDNDSSGKFAVKVSMSNLDDNKSMNEFHSKMSEIDNFLVSKAVENSQAWFRKKLSRDAVEALYTPMVRCSTDPETGEPNGKYPDSFAFKIVKKDGVFPQFSIYDQKKTDFDVNNATENPTDISNILIQGSLIKTIIKCNGIWIANGKFGCTWRAEQIRVKLPEGGLREYAILSDSDDEEADSEVVTDAKVLTTMLEDSTDDEEEEVKEEVKEPTPPVKAAKKKGRTVKVKKDKN